MADRPALLFYCQHALGLGHLVRSLSLAESLCEHFDVVNLPPLGNDSNFNLVSHNPDISLDVAMRERPRLILDELAITSPAVVLIELFPFGRKKFEFELLPLLDTVHSMGVERPRVADHPKATSTSIYNTWL